MARRNESITLSSVILTDIKAAPDAFRWNGACDTRDLADWLSRLGWSVPSDLFALWALTGGGEIFETERLLKPLVPRSHHDGVEEATVSERTVLLPGGAIVFHEGLGMTVVDPADEYIWFDLQGRSTCRYRSLEDWYVRLLRAEYGTRYGLQPL